MLISFPFMAAIDMYGVYGDIVYKLHNMNM